MDNQTPNGYLIVSVADIVQSTASKTEFVPTPEWSPAGTPDEQKSKYGVIVGEFARGDMHAIRAAARKADGRGGVEMDEELLDYQMFRVGVKQPQFTDEQIPLLRQLSNAPYQRVIKAIGRLNEMGDNAVKDAEKTFPDGQRG